MCHFILEIYNSCTAPESHFPKNWTVKNCNLACLNGVQCPNIQYLPTSDPVPCIACHPEAASPRVGLDHGPSPGPEFVGEFSMRVQIEHMKAVFDRRRTEHLVKLGDQKVERNKGVKEL
jgi:hypothetical protein